MIEEWTKRNGWQTVRKQKVHVLTRLSYSISDQRCALQASSKQTLLPSHFQSEELPFLSLERVVTEHLRSPFYRRTTVCMGFVRNHWNLLDDPVH